MPQTEPKIRLYVVADLASEKAVVLPREQAHYLVSVMRRGVGDRVALFNGHDGEWAARIQSAAKREVTLVCEERIRPQSGTPDLWLAFAPVKKARTDFIAEKACELGCRRVVPVFTDHTNSERVNVARLRAHAVEAAEQCGLLTVPEIAEPCALAQLLRDVGERRIMFCDEGGAGVPAPAALAAAGGGPWLVLIGPEGGFSQAEAAGLRADPRALCVSLGPRILRADTAAVAALTIWQAALGDWR
ncbi:MAG: 16S rRNA (uracil(1498)-N(3))-methyltransferase [Pseudomonadota bacterium]